MNTYFPLIVYYWVITLNKFKLTRFNKGDYVKLLTRKRLIENSIE